jgi:hypothetical protein
MDIFSRHEIFEIEVLDKLNSVKLLEPLVFGGGTMLRLCHELSRYSVDLDFWFLKRISEKGFFDKLRQTLERDYEVTDAQIKRFTIRVEIRKADYPKRLKIEIRREERDSEHQLKIAFSRFSTRQVLLRAHTLDQTMRNKIEALRDRNEVRDGFDIEFLLRRGVPLPELSNERLQELRKKAAGFKDPDFKVKLGSIVDVSVRAYYVENRFGYLLEKLNAYGHDPKS